MSAFCRILSIGVIICLGVGAASAADGPRQNARIEYGQSLDGSIPSSGADQDWGFAGQAGDLVVIEMRYSTGDLDPYLTLLTPDGMTFRTDDDSGDSVNSRIGPVRLPETGDYTILAGSYSGSGAYTLSLANLNTIPTLVPGKPLAGAVSAARPNEYFLVATGDAPTGRLFRLEVSTDGSVYVPWLSLYGPDGIISSTETAYDQTALDPVAPLPGDTYMVVVTWNSSGSSGTYQLSLVDSEIELLQDGVTQTCAVDYENYVQRHYFYGEAGTRVRLTVRTDDAIAPALAVHTVDYMADLFNNSGEGAREIVLVLTIPISSTYMVEVSDSTYSDAGGTYEITMEELAAG